MRWIYPEYRLSDDKSDAELPHQIRTMHFLLHRWKGRMFSIRCNVSSPCSGHPYFSDNLRWKLLVPHPRPDRFRRPAHRIGIVCSGLHAARYRQCCSCERRTLTDSVRCSARHRYLRRYRRRQPGGIPPLPGYADLPVP